MIKKVVVVIALLMITTLHVSAQCDTADIVQNFWDSLNAHPSSISTERAVTLMECKDSFSVIKDERGIYPEKFNLFSMMHWKLKITRTILHYRNGWKTHMCKPHYFEKNKFLIACLCGYSVLFLLLIWHAFHQRNYLIRELQKRNAQPKLYNSKEELLKDYLEEESSSNFGKMETFFYPISLLVIIIISGVRYGGEEQILRGGYYHLSLICYTLYFSITSLLLRRIITCWGIKKIKAL
ncbi:MAG: hypothetical protein WCQ32_03375 [bacterium]